MNRKHGTNCRPNRLGIPRKIIKGGMPCGISEQQMSKCWEPNCYLNYKCAIYKGKHINPPMNFIPMHAHDHPSCTAVPASDGTDMWFQHCLHTDVV